ncbi:hypothetical protein CBM2626_B50157 [Cupriavidus taiwanensis]|nr:hypothetical protein CBM2626_B50157 [Cupriavidus taiwanensis]
MARWHGHCAMDRERGAPLVVPPASNGFPESPDEYPIPMPERAGRVAPVRHPTPFAPGHGAAACAGPMPQQRRLRAVRGAAGRHGSRRASGDTGAQVCARLPRGRRHRL